MDNFLEALLNPESMEFSETWSTLFFNVEGVCRLVSHSKDPAIGTRLLGAGAKWEGAGWTTGRASRAVYAATGVAMVDEHLKDYLESFLFALSLAYNIDIPKLQLKAQAATAALSFADRVQQQDEGQRGDQRLPQRLSQRSPGVENDVTQEKPETKDGKEELEPMPWESQKEDLPEDLLQVMQRHLQGSLQLEARSLLEQMPVWKLVKERSEVNNHRQDSMRQQDKILKGLQQKVLGLMRIYPLLHSAIGDEENVLLGQMFFGLLLQFEETILQERKRQSIPGSLQQDNVLFTPEDMKIEREKTQLNKLPGRYDFKGSSGVFQFQEKRFYFQIGSGPKGFRWKPKGWKGFSAFRGGQGGGSFKGSGRGFPQWRSKGYRPSCPGGAVETHRGQQAHWVSHSGPFNSDLKSRKGIWPFGTFSKIEKQSSLVGKVCQSSSIDIAPGRNCTPESPPIFVTKTPNTFPKRDHFGQRDLGGLLAKWCSKKSGEKGHKTLSPLVHFIKARSGRSFQAPVDLGLSRDKSICGDKEISFGKLTKHFPFFKKGRLGRKNRFKGCLLSHPPKPRSKTLPKDGSRGGVLGISSGMFWFKCDAPHFYASNEDSRKKVEISRYNRLHIFRRHTFIGVIKGNGSKATWTFDQGHLRSGVQGKLQKVGVGTHPSNPSLRIRLKSPRGKVANLPPKTQDGKERVGKIGNKGSIDMSKDGLNFRPSTKFSSGPSIFKGFYRHSLPICKHLYPQRLELPTKGSQQFERSTQRDQNSVGHMGRKTFFKDPPTRIALRFFNSSLGGIGSSKWTFCQRFLARGGNFTYKCKGTQSGHSYGEKLGKTQTNRPFVGGQSSNFLLSYQRWGEKKSYEQSTKTLFQLVPREGSDPSSEVGTLKRNVGRQIVKVGFRQRGLHPPPKYFQSNSKEIFEFYNLANRHVCLTGKQEVGRLRFPVAPLAIKKSGCTQLPPPRSRGPLCKPPMVGDCTVDSKTPPIPRGPMFDGSPLLGFRHMVAPINKNASPQIPLSSNCTGVGDVPKLPRDIHAASKMAPNLYVVLRKMLQSKEVQGEIIENFLEHSPSIKRYDSAFRILWVLLSQKGLDPPKSTLEQIASGLIELHNYSPSQAKNAYSAILMLPGFYHLRFLPLLLPYKKLWNANVEKYGAFWDCTPMLLSLIQIAPPDPSHPSFRLLDLTLPELRERLIICSRLLCLFRSNDLANLIRSASILQGNVPFIKIRRKGWKTHKWERLISIPQFPQISPWHLIRAYVHKTSKHGKPGGPLLLSLKKPYRPLSSGSIATITSNIMKRFDISPKVWGAHSTRGAGVSLYRRLGLSADEVCEIGKWKNVTSFAAHYQRLEAHHKAGEHIESLVHNASQWGSAEPKVSRTPRKTWFERGGRDSFGEAQSHCEPAAPSQVKTGIKRGAESPESSGSEIEKTPPENRKIHPLVPARDDARALREPGEQRQRRQIDSKKKQRPNS